MEIVSGPVPLEFPLPGVVITTDTTPHLWAFYFQDSGFHVSHSGTWSGSMHKVHIALQEPHAVVLMMCKMAFYLSGKVAALHLDNSIANAYFCNQGHAASLFLSGLACHILSVANKLGITLIVAHIHI